MRSKKIGFPKKKYRIVKTPKGNIIIWEEGSKDNICVLLKKEKELLISKHIRDKEKCLKMAAELPAENVILGRFDEAFLYAETMLGWEKK